MAKDETTPPEIGEATGKQSQINSAGGSSTLSAFRDFNPGPGHYDTYRKMKDNPTIALARMVATSPIRTAKWTIEADDDAPDGAAELIEATIKRLWPSFVSNVLLALDYGHSNFEKVFEREGKNVTVVKLKPLLVDNTEQLVDEATGAWAGVRNFGKTLLPEKCFRYTYDEEAGNYYGRSRHENVRSTAWREWMNLYNRREVYGKRVAGGIPRVYGPDGDSISKEGATLPNYLLAKKLLDEVENGRGVWMTSATMDQRTEAARAGIDPDKLSPWKIDIFEGSGKGGAELTAMMEHSESLMLRGWFVPERGAVEARQAGSRADSDNAGDLALAMAGLILQDIMRELQCQLVDQVMVLNFGSEAKGTVRIAHAGLDPALVAFYRQIMAAVLGQPGNIDVMLELVDMSAMLDHVGVPMRPDAPDPKTLEGKIGGGQPANDPEKITEPIKALYRGAFAFGNEDQPRAADGKWTSGGGGGKLAPDDDLVTISKDNNVSGGGGLHDKDGNFIKAKGPKNPRREDSAPPGLSSKVVTETKMQDAASKEQAVHHRAIAANHMKMADQSDSIMDKIAHRDAAAKHMLAAHDHEKGSDARWQSSHDANTASKSMLKK